MKCPSCPDTTLVMTDRQGVEIDYCPTCRGVWLDRGELDKLLDRAAVAVAPPVTASASAPRGRQQPDFEDSDYRDGATHKGAKSRGLVRSLIEAAPPSRPTGLRAVPAAFKAPYSRHTHRSKDKHHA